MAREGREKRKKIDLVHGLFTLLLPSLFPLFLSSLHLLSHQSFPPSSPVRGGEKGLGAPSEQTCRCVGGRLQKSPASLNICSFSLHFFFALSKEFSQS